jgi:hypothetical protein
VFTTDIHYPEYDKPTKRASFGFLGRVEIGGFIFGGDQHNNDCISYHTKNEPLYRMRRAFKDETDGFEQDFLTPLEKALAKSTRKVWINGNHERFAADVVEEMPELDGQLDRVELYVAGMW